MYKNIVFAFVLMMSLPMMSSAQVGSGKQVSWAFSAKKMGDKMYEVRITATIA
jgi:hypothetical protein